MINSHYLFDYFVSLGMSESNSQYLNVATLSILLLTVVFLVDFLLRKTFIKIFARIAVKSDTKFDDYLVQNKTPQNIAHVIPLLISLKAIPIIFVDFKVVGNMADKMLQLFGIILTLWIVRSVLNSLKDFFKTLPQLKDKPVDSYIQVFMIFAWIAGMMFAFALLTGTSIWKFFTVLGAASAVILLIFKDTIMGFVASIQVSVNDMVRIGDWITFEKYGADGDVIEINLSTVKVQNFDMTITTIPTYALISDSFKNWRGMSMSGGRRIKRSIHIKQESVRFLTDSDIPELLEIELISSYIESRKTDINNYNNSIKANKEVALNGRNLTNIGVFREYIETYLKNHSAINKDMTVMVRQLAPSSQGIPIEVYAFSSDKRWVNYEYIMADIFDHILASIPFFHLELFELPSGKLIP
jgi:miniconductance mechanosensitive channel